jgi:transposase-like protein
VVYLISYRQLEEMMEEHGVEVDHATLNRRVLKSSAQTPNGSQLANAYVQVLAAVRTRV